MAANTPWDTIYTQMQGPNPHRPAIDTLFDWVDDLLLSGDITAVDDILASADLDQLDSYLWIALLSITLPAKDVLQNRPSVVVGIRARLQKTQPEHVESLMQGLE